MKIILRLQQCLILILCFSCTKKVQPSQEETIPMEIPSTHQILPTSIQAVASAIPVFVGYTEKDEYEGESFTKVLKKVNSMAEYEKYFGAAQLPTFEFLSTTTINSEMIQIKGNRYYLYESLKSFFANGGGACYILSVGKITDTVSANALKAPFKNDGVLAKETAPTLVIVPDALSLDATNCYDVYKTVLQHCSSLVNRFAIFDLHDGFDKETMEVDVEKFRTNIGNQHLKYAAAYYPWVQTTIFSTEQFSYLNLENEFNDLVRLITEKMSPDEQDEVEKIFKEFFQDVTPEAMTLQNKKDLHQTFLAFNIPTYKELIQQMNGHANQLPTASMLAAIYQVTDASRGVWKAPANITLNSVIKPTIDISTNEQEDLNVTPNGKSINAIRFFVGQGTLIWGARTLDGNSLEWRYINVRRTISMIEASIKNALADFNTAPNTPTTWEHAEKIINDFLEEQFRQGALAGASSRDAYSVRIGLGSTMTSSDILDGKMKVSVLVALVRPAEFIEIRMEQEVKK